MRNLNKNNYAAGSLSLPKGLATAAISISIFLAACGDDKNSSSSIDSQEVTPIADKTISGVSQKGPFVNGSSVTVQELDGETLAQTGFSYEGKIKNDKGVFSVKVAKLASQFVLLKANGFYRNEVSGDKSKSQITLYALTDVSDRDEVNVNLLTHLEHERSLYLVSENSMTIKDAKKQAEGEILASFGIEGEFANTEDLNIFGTDDGAAALLAVSVLLQGDLSEADFSERLAYYASDIESDGKWDDSETATAIADWASSKSLKGELANIRNNIAEWKLSDDVPAFEKYVDNFWWQNYGLGICDDSREGEVLATTNKHSVNYESQVRYICRSNSWQKATDFEKDTYNWDVGKNGEIRIGEITGKEYRYYEMYDKWMVFVEEWDWSVAKESYLNPEVKYDSLVDERDGRVYKTVKIGNQIWMAENLNYADSNKTPILKENSWCYENEVKNCEVAGRYYDVSVITDICPQGWHIPSQTEWVALIETIGGTNVAGKILRSKGGWRFDSKSIAGTDDYGFSAVPAGYIFNPGNSDDPWIYEKRTALFWSSSQNDDLEAICLSLKDIRNDVSFLGQEYPTAASVRCIKNEE